MGKRKQRPDYTKDQTYYLQVVTTNKKGKRFKDGMARIKLTDCYGNYIQWVNDSQAAQLEQELPGQIQWR
jgi:hypothetical protein